MDFSAGTGVSIIASYECREYLENYNNSTLDCFQHEYIKIKHTEIQNGIVYNYGIIFPHPAYQKENDKNYFGTYVFIK